MYERKQQCSHYLGIIFLIKTMFSVFRYVVITTLKLLKFPIIATSYVLTSLPCMISLIFTLRLFIGLFSHNYHKFSRTTVVYCGTR